MGVHLNKVIIIIDASSGIGASAAMKFTAEGAKVALIVRNEIKLKKVAEKCEKFGNRPLVMVGDVTRENDLRDLVNNIVSAYGKLDVLVNNTGIIGSKTILEKNDCVQWYDSVFATNVRAPIQLSHLAIPYLLKTKGNIVNISSIAGINPISINFVYCASKAALDHFTRCIAYELGPKGVRANCVTPGPVKTDIIENMGKAHLKQQALLSMVKTTVLERISEPEEIAELISFVASDAAKCITGITLVGDNGTLLRGCK